MTVMSQELGLSLNSLDAFISVFNCYSIEDLVEIAVVVVALILTRFDVQVSRNH